MANMKSKVCTKANALVKKGYTKSEAFTKAWALVKAEAISHKLHVMGLSSDRFTNTSEYRNLNNEYGILMNRANSIQTAEEVAAIAVQRQKEMDAYNRREDIKFELSCMVRSGKIGSDEYNALRAELQAIAA